MDFIVKGEGVLPKVELEKAGSFQGIDLYRLTAKYETKSIPEPFTVQFRAENRDAYAVWAPNHLFMRCATPTWRHKDNVTSDASHWAPIYQFMDKNDCNLLTVAVSDLYTRIDTFCGIDERSGKLEVNLSFFTLPHPPVDCYETILMLDSSYRPYYESLNAVRDYWEKDYPEFQVPDAAHRRTYSSWYSFQRDVDASRLVEQCRMAKEYGMDTMILDDGWQTPGGEDPYHDIGNWETCEEKFPNMEATVEEIHNLGMRVMFWIAMPFIGPDCCDYPKLKNMILKQNYGENHYILDPRYAQVRAWYVQKLTDLMQRYHLDGFKLDFIDRFEASNNYSNTPAAAINENMDIPEFGHAVDRLLKQVAEALRAIKPDVLIEFRQEYVGPAMQQCANMMRVDDYAYGAMYNRVNGIDLRLLCRNTAVHSDMLMWDYDASVEAAADQLSNILFITPQISMLFEKLPESHRKMLQFYLDFMDEHRDILQGGQLVPLHPEALYSAIYAEKEHNVIAGLYAENSFTVPAGTKHLTLINATGRGEILLDSRKAALSGKWRICNCMGEETASGETFSELAAFEIPWNGFLFA